MVMLPAEHIQIRQEAVLETSHAHSRYRPPVSLEKIARLRKLMPQILMKTLSHRKAAILCGMSAPSCRRYIKKIKQEQPSHVQPQPEAPQNEPPERAHATESTRSVPVALRISVVLPDLLSDLPSTIERADTPPSPYFYRPRYWHSSPCYPNPVGPSPVVNLVEEQFSREIQQPPVVPTESTEILSSHETCLHFPGMTPTADDIRFADSVWADPDPVPVLHAELLVDQGRAIV